MPNQIEIINEDTKEVSYSGSTAIAINVKKIAFETKNTLQIRK